MRDERGQRARATGRLVEERVDVPHPDHRVDRHVVTLHLLPDHADRRLVPQLKLVHDFVVGRLVVGLVVTERDGRRQNDMHDATEVDEGRLDTEHVDLLGRELVVRERATHGVAIDSVLHSTGEAGDGERALHLAGLLGQQERRDPSCVAAELAAAHLEMRRAFEEAELLDAGVTSHHLLGDVRVLRTMRLVVVTDDPGRVSTRGQDHVVLQSGAHARLVFLPCKGVRVKQYYSCQGTAETNLLSTLAERPHMSSAVA